MLSTDVFCFAPPDYPHEKLPKGVLDVMLVIHYYEAWLATLAILVWHGYSVIVSPHVYPTNPAWIGGRMPKDMYVDEHPEGPKLRARVQRVLDEEEEEDVPEPPAGARKTEVTSSVRVTSSIGAQNTLQCVKTVSALSPPPGMPTG